LLDEFNQARASPLSGQCVGRGGGVAAGAAGPQGGGRCRLGRRGEEGQRRDAGAGGDEGPVLRDAAVMEDIRGGAAQQREMLVVQRQRLDEATALALFEGLRSPAAAIAFLSWGWSLGGWWMAFLTIIAFLCDPPTTMMIVGGSILKSCFVRMGRCFLVRWCCGRRQAAPPVDVPLGPLEEVAPQVGASPAPGWGFWLLGALIPRWMRAEERWWTPPLCRW
jgi:hypothetical protein